MHTWRLVVVGVLAGAAAGLFGVGGGIVVVPGLVLVAGMDQRRAHGTSLAAIVPVGVSGVIGYATAGEVDWLATAVIAAGAMVGAPIGAALLEVVPLRWLQRGFAAIAVVTAIRLLVETPSGAGRGAVTVLAVAGLLLTGLASGILAGIMGVGGGVIIVPSLTVLFALSLVMAKGTSLAVIVPTAVAGTVRNVRRGNADLRAAAIVGAGGVVTGFAASKVSLGLDPEVSAALFAALLVVTAFRMLRRADDPA